MTLLWDASSRQIRLYLSREISRRGIGMRTVMVTLSIILIPLATIHGGALIRVVLLTTLTRQSYYQVPGLIIAHESIHFTKRSKGRRMLEILPQY